MISWLSVGVWRIIIALEILMSFETIVTINVGLGATGSRFVLHGARSMFPMISTMFGTRQER
jgi:hypothetical protein